MTESEQDPLQIQLDALAVRSGWRDAGSDTWMVGSWRVGVSREGLPRYLAFREGDLREFVLLSDLENFVNPRYQLPKQDKLPPQNEEARRRLFVALGITALFVISIVVGAFILRDKDESVASSPLASSAVTEASADEYCGVYDDTEADYQERRGNASTEYSFGETAEMFRTRAGVAPVDDLRQDWLLLGNAVELKVDFDRPSVKQDVDDATDRIDAYNQASCGFDPSGDAAHRYAVDYVAGIRLGN
jgi:hypothetical protein